MAGPWSVVWPEELLAYLAQRGLKTELDLLQVQKLHIEQSFEKDKKYHLMMTIQNNLTQQGKGRLALTIKKAKPVIWQSF